jgi:hypothetical protein
MLTIKNLWRLVSLYIPDTNLKIVYVGDKYLNSDSGIKPVYRIEILNEHTHKLYIIQINRNGQKQMYHSTDGLAEIVQVHTVMYLVEVLHADDVEDKIQTYFLTSRFYSPDKFLKKIKEEFELFLTK